MGATFLAASAITEAYTESTQIGVKAGLDKVRAETNQKILNLKAEQTISEGEKQALEMKKRGNKLIGEQRAAAAASGVVVDSGSAGQLTEETDLMSTIDAERIKNNAALEAFGYRSQGINEVIQARAAQSAARIKQSNTLLGGAIKGGAHSYDAYTGEGSAKDKAKDNKIT